MSWRAGDVEGATQLLDRSRRVVIAVEALLDQAAEAVRRQVTIDGQAVDRLLDRQQRATHALAWLATYVEGLRQVAAYGAKLDAQGCFGEVHQLLVALACDEYLAQIAGGIPMSQGEIARPSDYGLSPQKVALDLGRVLAESKA